jgi:integrase
MYDTADMKRVKSAKIWEKTRRQNLWRHRSGIYYARLFNAGKQIWRSLKTPLFSVAEARLDAQLTEHRKHKVKNTSVAQGKLTFSDALSVVNGKLKSDPKLKPATRKYHAEIFAAIVRTWSGIATRPLNKITDTEMREWFELWKAKTSATRYNATLTAMRRIFKVGIDAGALFIDPTQSIGRSRVRQKKLELPSREQFSAMIEHIRTAGGRFSRDAADFVCGLAFTGLRTGEAKHLLWRDLDLEANRLHVRGDAETGTKNWETRLVPLIPAAIALFQRMRSERPREDKAMPVFLVNEAQKALDRAAKIVGSARIIHHDLRHLFATTCIEAGVDIPTVSRWLGHKDGGALAMKTYGHLRDEHSAAAAKKVSFAA